MKRAPKVGDLLMIGTSTKPMLVVETNQHRSEEAGLRGEIYYATTFEVIAEDKTGTVNPKTKKYVLDDASMNMAKHTTVDLDDLFLADSIKLKKKVITQVTYERKK